MLRSKGLHLQCCIALICHLCLLRVHSQTTPSSCTRVYPDQYIYPTDSIQNADTEDAQCTTRSIDSTMYTFCNDTVRITDGDQGPSDFNNTVRNNYYRWNDAGGRVLFLFPSLIYLEFIQLHYYIHNDPMLILPKVRLYLVNRTFGIDESITQAIATTVEAVLNGPNGLANVSMGIMRDNGFTNGLLLDIVGTKNRNLALSEITFCASDIVEVPTTAESTELTNSSTSNSTLKPPAESTVSETRQQPNTNTDTTTFSGQKANSISLFFVLLFLFLSLFLR